MTTDTDFHTPEERAASGFRNQKPLPDHCGAAGPARSCPGIENGPPADSFDLVAGGLDAAEEFGRQAELVLVGGSFVLGQQPVQLVRGDLAGEGLIRVRGGSRSQLLPLMLQVGSSHMTNP